MPPRDMWSSSPLCARAMSAPTLVACRPLGRLPPTRSPPAGVVSAGRGHFGAKRPGAARMQSCSRDPQRCRGAPPPCAQYIAQLVPRGAKSLVVALRIARRMLAREHASGSSDRHPACRCTQHTVSVSSGATGNRRASDTHSVPPAMSSVSPYGARSLSPAWAQAYRPRARAAPREAGGMSTCASTRCARCRSPTPAPRPSRCLCRLFSWGRHVKQRTLTRLCPCLSWLGSLAHQIALQPHPR